MTKAGRMEKIVRGFRNRRVLVLGDLMLDTYIWGSVSRISPEAPVPVVEVAHDTNCLGGAGNVTRNLESLGAAPVTAGVVGRDPEGRWIRRHVPDGRGVFMDPNRPTTVKTRIIAGHQQVVRFDKERRRAVSDAMRKRLAAFVRKEGCRGIILSDYGKGILTPELLAEVLPAAAAARTMVFVDPKNSNIRLFAPVTLLTPNHLEAERIVGHECRTDAQVERAGAEILDLVGCRYLILKRGEHGMSVFERGQGARPHPDGGPRGVRRHGRGRHGHRHGRPGPDGRGDPPRGGGAGQRRGGGRRRQDRDGGGNPRRAPGRGQVSIFKFSAPQET